MTSGGWGWKKATDPDDVANFLNGCGPYEHPVKDAHITCMWLETHLEFHIFYQPAAPTALLNNWAWKMATDPNDIMNFLNGTGDYCQPVKDARIVSDWHSSYPEFYVFYTMECLPSRIVDCKLVSVTDAAPGLARIHLRWAFCAPCELPGRLEITVYHEKLHWENIMPDRQPSLIKDAMGVTEADVTVRRGFKGPHKIVFRARYSNREEMEFAFERLID